MSVTVPVGGSYNGILPGWGTGRFSAASTGLVISANSSTDVLSHESLQDVTSQVQADGQVNITFSSQAAGVYYVLWGYYLVHSLTEQPDATEQYSPEIIAHGVPQSPVKSYLRNGSYVWDHFSSQGAQVAINYWEKNLLNGDSTNLLRTSVNYLWEDSMVGVYE